MFGFSVKSEKVNHPVMLLLVTLGRWALTADYIMRIRNV